MTSTDSLTCSLHFTPFFLLFRVPLLARGLPVRFKNLSSTMTRSTGLRASRNGRVPGYQAFVGKIYEQSQESLFHIKIPSLYTVRIR